MSKCIPKQMRCLASFWNCRHWATGLGGRQAAHSRPLDRRRRTPDGRACCDDVVVRSMKACTSTASTEVDSAWAIPPWVGKNEYWLWLWPLLGRNGESCVTVGPVTRTAGILAYSRLEALAVNGAGHPADVGRMLAYLKLDPHRLKAPKGDRLPRNRP